MILELRPEFRFHQERKWRADYACFVCDEHTGVSYDAKVLIEVDGGIWAGIRGGRSAHVGGVGQLRDMEKQRAAALLGYRMLRYTPQDFKRYVAEDVRALWPECSGMKIGLLARKGKIKTGKKRGSTPGGAGGASSAEN